jgi:type IV pilus assembly protein PilM
MKPFIFPAIGVDISDESFKYVRLEMKHGRRELALYGDKDLKKGIVEMGEIKDIKALALELRSALHQHHRAYPYLILSLPEEKGFLRLIRMQRIPEDEIRQALEFQLEEHIPLPPDEAVFDYQVIPSNKKGDMEVAVTAYPKNLVEAYMEVVRQAGFIPVIFELESQAVARAVSPKGATQALLVGDIGRTRTTFSIVWRGAVHFTSTVKIGGRDIDAILKDALHVTDEEAREIKIGRGIDFSSEEIIKSLSPALGVLKDEASRQINFWRHRIEEEPPIGQVYLCGGDAHLKGLPEFLTHELGISTLRARIWENLFDTAQYVPPMSAHLTMRFATAYGLALRGDDDLFRSTGPL